MPSYMEKIRTSILKTKHFDPPKNIWIFHMVATFVLSSWRYFDFINIILISKFNDAVHIYIQLFS